MTGTAEPQILTFGCRLNAAESSAIAAHAPGWATW